MTNALETFQSKVQQIAYKFTTVRYLGNSSVLKQVAKHIELGYSILLASVFNNCQQRVWGKPLQQIVVR